MANVLKMAIVDSILSLHSMHYSQRRIARELGIDRETVGKYMRERSRGPKPANAPTGSAAPKPATFSGPPAPDPKPANAPIGVDADSAPPPSASPPAGPASQCEPHREAILAGYEQGLSATRIWQDLVATGAAIGYDSVRRYLRRLGRPAAIPFRRIECGPGGVKGLFQQAARAALRLFAARVRLATSSLLRACWWR